MKKNPVTVIHALLASSGFGAIADALVNLHGAAQAGGFSAGVAALAVTAVSFADHSRKVAEFAHFVAAEESKIVTPGVVSRVAAVEAQVAKIVPVGEVAKMVEAAVAKVEQEIPAPAKVAVDDLRPLVADILRPLGPLADMLVAAPAEAPPIAAAPAPGTTQQAA